MASIQRFLSVIFFALNAYAASCSNAGSDFVIPIPEVTVTIGGSVSSIPVQYEELVIPIVFEPVQNTQPSFSSQTSFSAQSSFSSQPNYQPNFDPYQNYMPQPPPVIILEDGNRNDLSWLYLLLLLGNFNNGGRGNNCGGGTCCNYEYTPRSTVW